jgi:hypothetical protein
MMRNVAAYGRREQDQDCQNAEERDDKGSTRRGDEEEEVRMRRTSKMKGRRRRLRVPLTSTMRWIRMSRRMMRRTKE